MIIKEIFIQTLLESAKFSVIVILLLALTKPIMKRYTAGFRYYSWLAVILIFMIPFGGMGIKIDTSSVTAGVENEIRAAYYNLAPKREESVEVTSKVPADYADIPLSDSGEPIYAEEEPVTATVTYAEPVDILLMLSAVWAMGAAVFFLLHIYRYFSFRRSLKRLSYASNDENADKILRDEARALNISSVPPVRISAVTGTPMLVGILRPLLILSEREYYDDELRLIFRHELTHYKRKDILYQFIILIFLSLHWFNPFAYIMAKAAEIDGETACDEQVLKGEEYETRVFYGEMLIKLLKSQNQKKSYMTTTFFGGKSGMKKRLTLIASKKLKKKGTAAMALLMALTILSSLTAAAADSGYFDSVFEGDTSYLADFIQTPKQSVSDENYIFTLEQYLVTDNAALVIYSIEAKTEDAAAELNAVDERGYSTFFDMDTISFVPTDFEKVRFGGFCDGSLANGKYDTETKKYYMVDCVDFSNPEDIAFTLSLNKINGAPKITVPMAKNIETETAVLGDVTIKYSPISLEVIAPYADSPIIDDFCGTFGYYIYFKMNDGSIKTVSQLYELSAMGVKNDAVGNELPSAIYLSKEVIEPESFKSVIVYNVEYEVNDSEEPFGVSENALSCLEYPLGDTENPKEFNLPDELKPFVIKPYVKDFLRIPLRELCEHIGADIKWDNDTQSAIVKYRGSEYIIPNNSCVFTKDGETIDMYNDLTDRATFTDENGRMIINEKITDAMDISTHMIGYTDEDTGYDVRKFLMHILP